MTNRENRLSQLAAGIKKDLVGAGTDYLSEEDALKMATMGRDPLFFRRVLETFPKPVSVAVIYERWKEMRQ